MKETTIEQTAENATAWLAGMQLAPSMHLQRVERRGGGAMGSLSSLQQGQCQCYAWERHWAERLVQLPRRTVHPSELAASAAAAPRVLAVNFAHHPTTPHCHPGPTKMLACVPLCHATNAVKMRRPAIGAVIHSRKTVQKWKDGRRLRRGCKLQGVT